MTQIFLTAASSKTFHLPKDWSAKPVPPKAPSDPLYGVKLKIARADQHIREVEQLIIRWTSSHRIIQELEPSGTREVIKLKIGTVPPFLPVMTGEAIANLRSALDLLACCLAIRSGHDTKGVYFPIADDANAFKSSSTQRKIKKLSPSAQGMIRRLKPYRGGRNLIWALNKARNEDIHIGLLPISVDGLKWRGRSIRLTVPDNGIVAFTYPQIFDTEVVLAECSLGTKIKHNLRAEFTIGISNVPYLGGKGLVPRLQQLRQMTKQIVARFERQLFK